MFFSIPSSVSKTYTPIGVKSITHIFFQPKNSRLFRYDINRSGAYVTVAINGKTIASHLLILPFCTQSPNAKDSFNWYDVALEVNMNVDCSEVTVTSETEYGCNYDTDDYDVVLVCSDKECDESKGYEYFETKQINLKAYLDANAYYLVQEAYKTALNKARAEYAKEHNLSVDDDAVFAQYPKDNSTPLTITVTYNGFTWTSEKEVYYYWDDPSDEDSDTWWGNNGYRADTALSQAYTNQSNKYWSYKTVDDGKGNKKTVTNAVEFNVGCDHEPTMFFAYQLKADPTNYVSNIDCYDNKLSLYISNMAEELIPTGCLLNLFQANNRIPMRKALYEIPQSVGIAKNINLSVAPYANQTDHNGEANCWYLFLFFGYRKLA